MDSYNLLLVVLGISILGAAWVPSLVQKYALSYPILFVAFGMLLYALPVDLPLANPLVYKTFSTHLTEICVIVALTGTGLKIDRRFSFPGWKSPLRLATLTMVLTIGVFAFAGWLVADLVPSAAMLLAASLAPTDPVLAGDVQVGDPTEGGEDNVRFALTGEAGLNDGLAFPFVHLSLALLPSSVALSQRLGEWLLMDVGYRLAVGLLFGYMSGRLLAYLIFGLPKKVEIKASAYGFVALAVTLTTYGLTELVQGYGFLAVFIASMTLRNNERNHEYHREMHDFSDQIERLLIVTLLILFGGALVTGLLDELTWQGALLGCLLVFVIRPVVGYLSLLGTDTNPFERRIISFFGIRGIGSFFYLAYAIEHGGFAEREELWSIAGFTVLLSVVLHGVLATPVMRELDRRNPHKPQPTGEGVEHGAAAGDGVR
jgi:NhaP-type Na+/H+ or K+/H+ antiporter